VGALLLIGAVALAARLAAWPASTPLNMDADAAHFLNVARCFARGQGFSNPAAWPAWMRPEHLPMPETFKEPGYPWAIAKVAPLVGDPFRAGKAISLVAGLLTPFLAWMLARRLHASHAVALVAGLLAAANPLLIAQSVRVMVESLFAATFTLLWVLLATRAEGRGRRLIVNVAAGVVAGIAFMLRAQTLLALPAIVALLFARERPARAVGRLLVGLAAALITASPFLLRNLRLFGSPFHSDVGAFGMLPYMDRLAFHTQLIRPPGALGWALAHPGPVIATWLVSALRFAVRTLPADLLGNPVWVPTLIAGLLLSLGRWRDWLFAWVFLGVTMVFVFAVNWDARYFTSGVPLWCAFAAMGAVWLYRAIETLPLVGRLRGGHLGIAALAAVLLLQMAAARRDVAEQIAEENDTAHAAAPFLHEHLAPDEAVMALTTSYYSYWADRPSRLLVIAGASDFAADVARYHVRYVALPTHRVADIAARYPGGALPALLVRDHEDPLHDLTIFRVGERGGRR
jgi:hypothetical protein